MAILYPDSEPRRSGGGIVPYHKQNATAGYLKHFANYMYLDFIAKNSDKRAEKDQARHELEIAERKLAFWRRHPNFDEVHVAAGMRRIMTDWKQEKAADERITRLLAVRRRV